MKKRLTITIDGPGGAGKSTVARGLAERIGYDYLDTGAMYRAVAYAHYEESPTDMESFLSGLSLNFSFKGGTKVLLREKDISEKIRTPEMAMRASTLSQDHRVRTCLTQMQREIGERGGIVVEGRDAGSVIFPQAELKFYLDADLTERARRRHSELLLKKIETDLAQIMAEIEHRDRADSEREIAPLVRPAGSISVDTTGKAINEVIDILERYVGSKEQQQ